METTIADRFKILIKELRMTNNSFAISIGKASTSINYIVDGKSKPGYELLEAVFKVYPQISRDWLLMGEGDIFRKKQAESNTGQMVDKIEQFFASKYELLLEQKNSVIAEQRFMLEIMKVQLGKLSDVIGETQTLPLWSEIQARA